MGGVSSTTYAEDLEDAPFTTLPNPIFTRGKPLSNSPRKRSLKRDSQRRRRPRSQREPGEAALRRDINDDDVSAGSSSRRRRQWSETSRSSTLRHSGILSEPAEQSSTRPSEENEPNGHDRHSGSSASHRQSLSPSSSSSPRPSFVSTDARARATDKRVCNSLLAENDRALVRRGADSHECPGADDDGITDDDPGIGSSGVLVAERASTSSRQTASPAHSPSVFRDGASAPSALVSPENHGLPTRTACSAYSHLPASPSANLIRPELQLANKVPGSGGQLQRRFTSAGTAATTMAKAIQHAPYGDLIPWGDPAWYRGEHTPYYTASHVAWRARVREFVEREITPNAHEWDENKAMPKDIFRKAADAGLLACTVGVPWPTEYAGPGPEGFDYFHELILIDELSRCGSGGVVWGLFGGLSIGLPPVVNFASKALKDRVVPECLSGNKIICLAISEPYAGSDVANLKCTAEKTPDGRHFIVNGEKKWITNGVFADYFTVAVRTGGKGAGGLSLLLIERSMPGVTTQQMKCTGVWPSGTAYITFDDVKVPVENLIGAENQGFKFIMYNFNHERWSLICQASRFARVCLEESFKFASKRATFGKKLLEHPVIRWKIAEMARQVEATHAQLELLTLQMNAMSKREAMEQLGGPLALLKVQSTKVFEYCAREAAQIFGGSSYVRGGQGEKVERLYREVRAYAIPGGSEEIMLDLAVRQAMKQAQAPRSRM